MGNSHCKEKRFLAPRIFVVFFGKQNLSHCVQPTSDARREWNEANIKDNGHLDAPYQYPVCTTHWTNAPQPLIHRQYLAAKYYLLRRLWRKSSGLNAFFTLLFWSFWRNAVFGCKTQGEQRGWREIEKSAAEEFFSIELCFCKEFLERNFFF